jgi:IPT/TIG domain
VPINVRTGAGQSNSIGFKVVPQIDNVSPTAGKVGSSVTINGQGFGSKTGAASVYFGRAKATVYGSWSNYIIKVNVPAGVSGTVPVQVVTDGGASQVRNYTVTK